MKPKISVIIPTFNSAGYLARALESVFNQSFTDYEVIVVDDGSTDNTEELARSFVPKIAYYRKSNGGPSSARNFGIGKSAGEYLAFLDSDDCWLPDKLRLQLEVFQRHSAAGLVGCGMTILNEKGRILIESRKSPGKLELTNDLIYRNNIASGSTLMIRRDVVDTVGLFDEELLGAEDWDYGLRVFQHFDIYFVEEPLVLKIDRTAGQSACMNGDLMLGCELKFMEKHRPYFEKVFSAFELRKAVARRYFSHTYAMLNCNHYDRARRSIFKSAIYNPMYIFKKRFILYLYKSIFRKAVVE